MTKTPSRRVKTVDTALDIISALKELDEPTVSELSGHLDLGTSTIYEHLSTLEAREYVIKHGDRYELSYRFLDLGTSVQQKNPLFTYAHATLEDLVEQTGEIAWLVIEEHGKLVNLNKFTGSHRVEKLGGRTGDRTHLHTSASGKAILAFLPRTQVEEIIQQQGLPAYTENTITDEEELFEELEVIRERGFALMDDEYDTGIRGVAAPIHFENNVVGAISLAGPANGIRETRFKEELPEIVLGAANEIELKLSYNVSEADLLKD